MCASPTRPKSRTFTKSAVLVALHEEHVARLHVAVNDAEGVGLAERRAHLPGDVRRSRRRQPAALQLVGQRATFEVLHRDEAVAVRGLPVVEDGHHVRVRDLRGDARLEEEAPREIALRVRTRGPEARVEHLDCAWALEPRLLADVDLAHPALREGAHDAHAAEQHGADQRVGSRTKVAGAAVAGNRGWRGAGLVGHAHPLLVEVNGKIVRARQEPSSRRSDSRAYAYARLRAAG